MLGEFFGVTGTTAALLELRSSLVRLSSTVNNPLDAHKLSKFKKEMQYACNFLDTKVKLGYSDTGIRKLERQITLIQNKDVTRLQRSYGRNIEGMTQEQLDALVVDVEKEIQNKVIELGAKPTVVNSFKKYNSTEVVSLGEYDLLLLQNYKQNYRRTLDTYIDSVKVNSFAEITAFGKKLYDIVSRGPGYLLSLVQGMFASPGANKERIRDLCLESVKIIRSYFSTSPNQAKSLKESSAELGNISIRRLLEMEGSSNVDELSVLFDDTKREFVSVMQRVVGLGLLSPQLVDDIVLLYMKAFRLDHDAEYICTQVFPEGSKLQLSLDEIDGMYNRLEGIGFFFLHRSNSSLMVESLKKMSFSSMSRTQIDPLQEKSGVTWEKAVSNIEDLCLAMIPAGTNIEGIEV